MVSLTHPSPPRLLQLGIDLIERSKPYRPRTLREFAEQEVVIPTGEYKDQPFRIRRQPFTGLLFDEIDSGKWPIVVITGPSQSSKSLCGFSIPALRTIVEYKEHCGLACPEADLHAKRWKIDLEPVMKASPRLREYLPTSGSGARGGDVKDKIEFSHGPNMLLFTRGGQDSNKAAVTLRWMFVTEAAGWSRKTETSKEGGLVAQLRARLRGFAIQKQRFVIEGTTTDEFDYPWCLRGSDEDDTPISTRSHLVCPCPHCGAWVDPEREHLKGWQLAKSDRQAAELTYWECPACRHKLTEDDRRTMNADVRLLHYGQTIDRRGRVKGDDPSVLTLWFRWKQFNNLIVPASNIGVEEWTAAQKVIGTEEREDAEKALCQFGHCLPYRSKLIDTEPLKPELIRRRRGSWERNILPPDTLFVTVGCDIGKWNSWWIVLAARANGVIHVAAYGSFNVCTSAEDEVESHLRAALHEIIDDTFEAGFHQAAAAATAAQMRLADSTWFDRGWMKNHVCDVVRSYGTLRDNRYRAAKGYGKTARRRDKHTTAGESYRHPPKKSKTILWMGTRWYAELDLIDKIVKFNFDADYWKLKIHEWLRTEAGRKGSLVFYRSDLANEHAQLTHHLTAEQLEDVPVAGRGFVKKWVKHGRNHWLDAAAMAAAALDYVGFRLVDIPDPSPSDDTDGDTPGRKDFYKRLLRAA